MVGRTSDVFIETHYRDGATTPVVRSFQKMNDEIKKSQGHAKTASKEFATFGKVVGGLITVELIRKLATFTVGVTRMSTEGARSVDQLNKSWGGFQKTIGTVVSTPLSGFFQEGSKALDGFSVQIEAFGVLYHKVFGGLADTPTINRLMGIKTTPFGPKAELAQMIKDAKLEERLAAIGEQVDQQVAQERQQKKQEGEKRHQETLRLAEKRAKDFEDLAKRLGPGTVGRNMGMTGGRPSLLAALMDPSSGAAKKATDLSGQSAYISGGKTGEQLALGFKHGLQTNKFDFFSPSENIAIDVGNTFRINLIGTLSQSYKDLLSGDFEGAIKGIGAGTLDSLVGGFTDKLADATVNSKFGEKLTDFVGDGTRKAVEGIGGVVSSALDGSLDMNRLRAIGSRAGGWLKGGVDAGFDWLLPDISSSWGPQGATFTAIKGGMENALRGGIVGAGIGGMIGDKITAASGAIGGAIGAIIGASFSNAQVGGAIGGLLTSVVDKIFFAGERQGAAKDYKNLITDVQSFGGVKGFFERIGGLKGIQGDRAATLLNKDSADSFSQVLRIQGGMTQEQAGGVMAVLQGRARNALDPELASEAMGVSAALVPQVINVMRSLGFSEGDIAGLKFSAGATIVPPKTRAEIDAQAAASDVPEANVGAKVSTSPIAQAQALLRAAQTSGTLSASALKALGWSGVVSQAINDVGGAWPSVGASIKSVMSLGRGGAPHDEAFIKRALGVDIVAAKGFMGTVNRPTRFLAGEAGPEDVMVIPQAMRRNITGGGAGRGGAVLNVTNHIHTPNAESMHQWARRDLYPLIRTWLMEDSNNGSPIIRSRGVVQG